MAGAALTDVQHTYPAVPGSVGPARRAITALAAEAGARTELVERVRLACSEALTNAVRHAYEGGEGEIQVTAAVACGELCVQVSDDGVGFRPHLRRGGLGLGLALIARMCDELQIVNRAPSGTDLRLWFKLDAAASAGGAHPRGSASSAIAPARSRFSTTTQPEPDSTTVSSPSTS
jgi:anti-sigma regulatory factor (Ser/Thr protein kinase)